jgi:hypothetical protein
MVKQLLLYHLPVAAAALHCHLAEAAAKTSGQTLFSMYSTKCEDLLHCTAPMIKKSSDAAAMSRVAPFLDAPYGDSHQTQVCT